MSTLLKSPLPFADEVAPVVLEEDAFDIRDYFPLFYDRLDNGTLFALYVVGMAEALVVTVLVLAMMNH